ncbi:MAG: twin-arginine translocase subunit TatB [Caulobacter sp.]|nr:twin-arginine translocase subunit TatB [Caulobacter sp.]
MLSPHIGVSEMLLVAAVALIVVGPKDLPLLMRRVGQFIARLRGMAAEFRNSFEDMARQTELDELRKEVEAMRSGQFTQPLQDTAEMMKDETVDQVFSDIDAGLKTGEVTFAPHRGYQPPSETADPVPEKKARKPRAKAVSDTPAKASPAKTPKAKAPKAKAPMAKAKPVATKTAQKATPTRTAAAAKAPRPTASKARTTRGSSA